MTFQNYLSGLVALQQKAAKAEENCLRRRQSLPAVPAALLIPGGKISNGTNKIDEDEVFTTSSSCDSPKNSKHKMPKEKGRVERRSSVAALRRDSCKIS